MKSSFKRVLFAVALMGALATAGCASDGSGTNDGGSTDATRVAEAKKFVADSTAEPSPEAAAPVKVEPGKVIGILNCGTAASDCNDMADAAEEAAEALGWTTTMADGKLSPQGFNAGLKKLVNDKVDGIVTIVAPDAAVPEPLKAAHEAGIPVVCVVCGNSLNGEVEFPSTGNSDADYELEGKIMAEFMIAQTGGKAQVAIQTNQTATATTAVLKGIKDTLKTCDGCSLVDETEVGQPADIVGAARSSAQATLARFGKGKLDYLLAASDYSSAGVEQAIRAAGRADDVKIVGGGCQAVTLAGLLKSDPVELGCVNASLPWASWGGIDLLARIFAGETVKQVDVPLQLITPDNAPAEGESATTFDYRAYYRAAWGL